MEKLVLLQELGTMQDGGAPWPDAGKLVWQELGLERPPALHQSFELALEPPWKTLLQLCCLLTVDFRPWKYFLETHRVSWPSDIVLCFPVL